MSHQEDFHPQAYLDDSFAIEIESMQSFRMDMRKSVHVV